MSARTLNRIIQQYPRIFAGTWFAAAALVAGAILGISIREWVHYGWAFVFLLPANAAFLSAALLHKALNLPTRRMSRPIANAIAGLAITIVAVIIYAAEMAPVAAALEPAVGDAGSAFAVLLFFGLLIAGVVAYPAGILAGTFFPQMPPLPRTPPGRT